MSSRNQFGKHLNDLGLTGQAVEVGTHRGEYARVLLTDWKGSMLHLVDPYWKTLPSYDQQTTRLPEKGEDRRADYEYAVNRLKPFRKRTHFVLDPSPEAANRFANGSLGFVYVDGDHTRDAVLADLQAWWPKLRPGGILAGHDWTCPGEDAGLWAVGIQNAVGTFTESNGVAFVHLIVEEGGLPWSYYMFKPKEGG
jgi:hypothetical protein